MTLRVLTAFVFLVAAGTTVLVMAGPDGGPISLLFLGPIVAVTAAIAVAMWRAELVLDRAEIRRRGLRGVKTVAVRDVERVMVPSVTSSGAEVVVFVTGRRLPAMSVNLRYWERSTEVRSYFVDLSARCRDTRRADAPAPPRTDDRRASEARRALAVDRWSKLAAGTVLLLALGLLVLVRAKVWALPLLVALVVVAVALARFASAVPTRWFESTPAARRGTACYAEVLPVDLRQHDLVVRTGLRSDGRLDIEPSGLVWAARYGTATLTVPRSDVDAVLIGPARWHRWFVVALAPDGSSTRFYVADDEAVAGALLAAGIDVRRSSPGMPGA